MPRLVEDTAVIDALIAFQPNWSREVLQSVINKIPTADVAPVVHAHWIPIYHRMYHCNDKIGEMVQTGYKCSACGIEEEDAWQICRCGARMDEGEKQ